MAEDSSLVEVLLIPIGFIALIIFSVWFQYEVMNLSVGYIVFDTIFFIGIMVAFAGNDGQ